MSIDWKRVIRELADVRLCEEGPRRVKWSDNYFDINFSAKNKISSMPNLQQAVPAGKAFLRWYMDGTAPSNTVDMFRVIFLNMRLMDGTNLMTDYLYGQNGSPQLIHPAPAEKAQLIPSNRTHCFNDFIWDLLNHHLLAKQQLGINILGFLLCTCVRMCVKHSEQVTTYIFSSSKDRFVSLWGCQESLPDFVPPCPKAFDYIAMDFKRLSPNCIKILTDYVSSYVRSKNETVQSVLCEGCLSTLKLNGLGNLRWLQAAERNTGISADRLTRCMAIQQHRWTNKALRELLTDFIPDDKNEKSWPWARLFEDGAFFDIRIKADPLYAMKMLALSVDADSDSELWATIPHFNGLNMNTLKLEAIKFAQQILGCRGGGASQA